MATNVKKTNQKEKKALLTFLKQTKDGKFAKIEQSSSVFSRVKEQRQPNYEGEYYYSVR